MIKAINLHKNSKTSWIIVQWSAPDLVARQMGRCACFYGWVAWQHTSIERLRYANYCEIIAAKEQ